MTYLVFHKECLKIASLINMVNVFPMKRSYLHLLSGSGSYLYLLSCSANSHFSSFVVLVLLYFRISYCEDWLPLITSSWVFGQDKTETLIQDFPDNFSDLSGKMKITTKNYFFAALYICSSFLDFFWTFCTAVC